MSLEDLTAVLVDDSEYSLSFIEEVTKMVGLNVRSFCCPLEALNYVRANSVDMVCTDFKMSKMDGLTFMREARKVHGDIPVVMITAETNAEELKEGCRKDVVSEFFVKPFPAVNFFDRIKPLALLQQYRKFLGSYRQKGEFRSHRDRVGQYARIIAAGLNWDKKSQDLIYHAALSHDLGMISMPDALLFKAERLTRNEMELVMKHTVIGHSMLNGNSNPYYKTAAAISLTHHERFNGSGYPFGLSGYAIPAEGRITSMADVFDALTSDRSYKKAWSYEKAFCFISDNDGMLFDPEIVNVFVENAGKVQDVYSSPAY